MMMGKGYGDAKGSGSSSRPRRSREDDDDDEEEEEEDHVEMEVAMALDTTECLAWPDLLLSQIFSVPASSLSKVFLDLDTNYNTSNSCVQCVEALDCDRMSNYMLKWEEEEFDGRNEVEDQGNDYTSELAPIIPPHWDGGNSMVGDFNSQPSGSLSTLLGNQTPENSSPLFTQSKTTNVCPSWLTQGWSMPSNLASKSEKGLDSIQDMKDPIMCSFMEGSPSTIRKAQKNLKGSLKTQLGEKMQGFELHNKGIKDVLMNSKIHLESPTLSTKRSRSSEIHNLSERRRRDRINEKMRALQELIPRSIKTDQASLLEEVIRYMKSLQNQVQIMSFRARICIPSLGIHPRQIEPLNMDQMVSSPNTGVNLTMEMNMVDNGALGITRKSFESSIPTGTLLPTPLQDYSLGTPKSYPTYRGIPVSNPFSYN